MLGVHVFNALPLSRSRFHDDGSLFAPMFDAMHEAVAREPLLPAHRGGYVSASQARLATELGLLNLVSRSRLAQLLGEDEHIAWLAGDVTKRRTPALYDYLIEEHDIEEVGTSDLLWRLDEEFLAGQDDKWIRRLYEFLSRQRPGRYQHYSVPLIRLEDGTHVARGYGDPPAFLPTEGLSSPQDTVRPAVCNSKPALAFLKSLGLATFDHVDAIIRDVIPRYRKPVEVDEVQYATDLRDIMDAYQAASPSRERQLTDILRKTSFVRAVDTGSGELSFAKPSDVYLATERLQALFEGVPSVLLVGEQWRSEQVTRLLTACGIPRRLATVESTQRRSYQRGLFRSQRWKPFGITHEKRLAMRRAGGQTKITAGRLEVVTDREHRGLSKVLKRLSTLPAEDAAQRAALLWDELSAAPKEGFEGTYTWFRQKQYTQAFESTSVNLLNSEAWVPSESGRLQQPRHVEFANLGWKEHAFLQSIIKFKQPEPPSEVDTLAKATGIDPDVLDVVKKEARGLSVDDIREALRSKRTSRAGRGADSAGSGATRRRPAPLRIQVEMEPGVTPTGQAEHDRKMEIEEAAITLIQEREPTLSRTPRNNPGYDLYETDASGAAVRWIEVKAIARRLGLATRHPYAHPVRLRAREGQGVLALCRRACWNR